MSRSEGSRLCHVPVGFGELVLAESLQALIERFFCLRGEERLGRLPRGRSSLALQVRIDYILHRHRDVDILLSGLIAGSINFQGVVSERYGAENGPSASEPYFVSQHTVSIEFHDPCGGDRRPSRIVNANNDLWPVSPRNHALVGTILSVGGGKGE